MYWDGSYGICCAEKMPPHDDPETYNIKNMGMKEWYNSKPIIEIRSQIKSNKPLDMCAACYNDERNGYESRRIKENFKTVIFTEQAFERSYNQSTFVKDFEAEDNTTDRFPIDWHIDLGNECNLACKMCKPKASSRVSFFYDKWQMQTVTANRNWTGDEESWERFKDTILKTSNLNRLHFMGGEPLLSKKFLDLLDFLADRRPDISISFVTNGTLVNESLIDKLKKFRSCDLEVSLESVKENNHYIRQGSDTNQVLQNIQLLKSAETDRFKVVLRSVPQLLNVNNYDLYIKYAWDHQLSIQGILLMRPEYLQISVLPKELRLKLIPQYQQLSDSFKDETKFKTIITGRNTSGLAQQLKMECDTIIQLLSANEPDNVDELRKQLCTWLIRWDKEFDLDARDFYPEYREFFDSIGYNV